MERITLRINPPFGKTAQISFARCNTLKEFEEVIIEALYDGPRQIKVEFPVSRAFDLRDGHAVRVTLGKSEEGFIVKESKEGKFNVFNVSGYINYGKEGQRIVKLGTLDTEELAEAFAQGAQAERDDHTIRTWR